jgi:RNA polymerase sigma factor (sigma-70 family)
MNDMQNQSRANGEALLQSFETLNFQEQSWLFQHLQNRIGTKHRFFHHAFSRIFRNIFGSHSTLVFEPDFEYSALTKIFDETLATLTPKQEKVIKMRFGLDDFEPKTLETIGNHFAFTRERIRQIEAQALRKLRHPSRSRRLKALLVKKQS